LHGEAVERVDLGRSTCVPSQREPGTDAWSAANGDEMRKVLLVVAALGLSGSTVAISGAQADRPSAALAAPVESWQQGYRAGTMTFSPIPGATCKPVVGTRASDRRCKLTFSGRFTATDRGYKGTYSGTATVNYLDPTTDNYAAFDSGSVTYKIRNLQGVLLDTVTLGIDLGTGGVYGFPYDTHISYWIEERIDVAPGIVLRMDGWGVNQLDANLQPIRTFIDRYQYN
jgi:hypothetical protein